MYLFSKSLIRLRPSPAEYFQLADFPSFDRYIISRLPKPTSKISYVTLAIPRILNPDTLSPIATLTPHLPITISSHVFKHSTTIPKALIASYYSLPKYSLSVRKLHHLPLYKHPTQHTTHMLPPVLPLYNTTSQYPSSYYSCNGDPYEFFLHR